MSDDETFGQLLHGTARAWRQKLDERLKPMGLSQAKWRTLMHLSIAPDAYAGGNCCASGRGRANRRDVIASPGAGGLDHAHKFSARSPLQNGAARSARSTGN